VVRTELCTLRVHRSPNPRCHVQRKGLQELVKAGESVSRGLSLWKNERERGERERERELSSSTCEVQKESAVCKSHRGPHQN
jgi:hypothetical protein